MNTPANQNNTANLIAAPPQGDTASLGKNFAPVCTADEPPRFGFTPQEVTWGWERDLDPSAYVRRLHAVNDTLREVNQLHPVRSIDFHAGRFVATMRALFESFGEAEHPIITLGDLDGTKADKQILRNRDLFIERKNSSKSQSIPIASLETSALDTIGFDVELYRKLPDSVKSFLREDITLLLMPSLHNPDLVIVSLEPKNKNTVADERYLHFLRRCADFEIPAALSRQSLSGLLGCYDVRELDRAKAGGKSIILFPQFSRPVESDPISAAFKKYETLSKTATLNPTHDQAVTADITARYRAMLYKLSGGAINLKTFADELNALDRYFASEERDVVTRGLTIYVVSALTRGQLRDLNGLQSIPADYRNSLALMPEDANRMRYFYDNLAAYTCLRVQSCVTAEGKATKRAIDLEVSNEVKQIVPLSGRDLSEIWDSREVPASPRLQSALRTRLDAFIESKLPGEIHRQQGIDVAVEIRRYAQMITIMKGESAGIGDGLDPEIAVSVVLFLERSVGFKLEALRAQVNRDVHGAKAILAKIDADMAAGRLPSVAPRLLTSDYN